MQNAQIGEITALTTTIFVTISVFMSRGNFRAAFGYKVSGKEVSNRFTGSQFQTNSQNRFKRVLIPKKSNSKCSNQFANLFRYGSYFLKVAKFDQFL